MAGRIPQHFIDELLNRIDIVDIIDPYVPLKKAGRNHQACCPFHDEKTPSFTVSQQKQFYHCFGCNANGTAISFLMEHLHIGFVEAIEELASRAGMEIPRDAIQASKTNNQSSELYELMEMVATFYSKQLRNHPKADSVINYLKGRGISGEIAAEYELGFAPPGWDNLMSELGGSDDSLKRLFKIGAIIENDRGGYYDRFRDRLIFPIRDQRGRAIGLGGRVLGDGTPKYLNSPETPLFHKGRELYGLYQARKVLKDIDSLYIVEGYMDVIALAQFGIRNVVASLGTAATPEHLEKMFRITGKLVFCFDGDNAGKKAAWRALENALPVLKDEHQINFIFLPDGEDPDSYVRTNGSEAFTSNEQLVPLSQFLFETLQIGNDCLTPEDQALMANKTLPYISILITRAPSLTLILLRKLCETTKIPVEKLEYQMEEYRKTGAIKDGTQRIKQTYKKDLGQQTLLTESIKLLLRKPQIALDDSLKDKLSKIEVHGIEFLVNIVKYIQHNPNATFAGIIENYRDRPKIRDRLTELAPKDSQYGTDDDSIFSDESISDRFSGSLRELEKKTYKERLREIGDINSIKGLTDDEKNEILSVVQKKQGKGKESIEN